jgi:hypothetical protein
MYMHKKRRARKLPLFVSFFLPIIIAALLTACGAVGGGGGKYKIKHDYWYRA